MFVLLLMSTDKIFIVYDKHVDFQLGITFELHST